MNEDQQQFADAVAGEVVRQLRETPAPLPHTPLGGSPPPNSDPAILRRLERIEAALGLSPLSEEKE